MTPDFGEVKASTVRVADQCYRPAVKDFRGRIVFMSIDTFYNRDFSSSINMSAREMAKRFIGNELRAEGHIRYRSGDYLHSYKGHAPFFDQCTDHYRCTNGYWLKMKGDRVFAIDRVPFSVLKEAQVHEGK